MVSRGPHLFCPPPPTYQQQMGRCCFLGACAVALLAHNAAAINVHLEPGPHFLLGVAISPPSDEADAHFYMAAILKCAAGVFDCCCKECITPFTECKGFDLQIWTPRPQTPTEQACFATHAALSLALGAGATFHGWRQPVQQREAAQVLQQRAMHQPQVEPGAQAWGACMLPLHYWCSC